MVTLYASLLYFTYISALGPRADMSYCIYALARRLSRTHNWASIEAVDSTFQEKLVNFVKTKGHMLNMVHFKDDSGPHGLWEGESVICIRRLRYLAQICIKSSRPEAAENSVGSSRLAQELFERCLDTRKMLLSEDPYSVGITAEILVFAVKKIVFTVHHYFYCSQLPKHLPPPVNHFCHCLDTKRPPEIHPLPNRQLPNP
ncbi:hypothetical protein POM88_021996 [Heracleum sosnowskyi]|uniref:Uncharacterized protein n=1 Tax=Heracleum sosnowskyi TaxID=360622 RepID=A0AAD8IEZ9_9APIA|nr:hypothetical protein POM88_021996 [Heracleum sosnowskyi]